MVSNIFRTAFVSYVKVADMYKDPSLGVLVNIVVAKVLILHNDKVCCIFDLLL